MKKKPPIKKYLHKIAANTKVRHYQERLRNLLMLPCSLGVGLVPPLLWLVLVSLWQHMGFLSGFDARPLTLAALLLSPFAAGFAHYTQRPQAEVICGATPSFILWLLAVLLYRNLFGTPPIRYLGITLTVALLSGIAGAMSAQRIATVRMANRQKKKAEE